MDYPEFDLEKIKQQSQDAEDKKAMYGAMGAVVKGFDDTPSSYSLLYGKGQGGGNSAQIFDNLQKQVSDPWEKQKKTFEAYKAAKEGEQLNAQTDPNSNRAKALKTMIAQKNGIDPTQLEGMGEKDLVSLYGDQGKLAEIKAQSQVNFQNEMAKQSAAQKFQASENQKNRDNDIEKILTKEREEQRKKNDPSLRLQNLSGTDKARYDNALMVAKAIDDMGGALDNNQNTFSLVGDNDYTNAERKAAEAYGRMQSGGAINKAEEDRFLAMLPRATDTKEMQRSKLIGQRNEMISRLKTLGFTPEQAGLVAEASFKYGSPSKGTNTAQASGKSVVKKMFSPSRNKTRIQYSDGTFEEIDGR